MRYLLPTRRKFLQSTLGLACLGVGGKINAQQTSALIPAPDPAPWEHRFLFYGDATVTSPGEYCYQNFARILTRVAGLNLRPDFILSGGDDIEGNCKDPQTIDDQWAATTGLVRNAFGSNTLFYTSPSNHNNIGPDNDTAFRRWFSFPANGAPTQRGLSYSFRQGNLLVVITHQSDNSIGGPAHVESEWLDQELHRNSDAKYKIAVGHYPVMAVNGLQAAPLARLVEPDSSKFWSALRRHGVQLYLCSHIQSFDGRAREGILQVCSAGACNGSRPPDSEYQHLSLFTLSQGKIKVSAIDQDGVFRESFSWPPPALNDWRPFSADTLNHDLEPFHTPGTIYTPSDRRLLAFRFRGEVLEGKTDDPQTWLSGNIQWQATETIWIGVVGRPRRLAVRLQPRHYFWQQEWIGPSLKSENFEYEILLDSSMGPGGVLWRASGSTEWNSFDSECSSGLEKLRWPNQWQIGRGIAGDDDKPLLGPKPEIEYAVLRLPWNG